MASRYWPLADCWRACKQLVAGVAPDAAGDGVAAAALCRTTGPPARPAPSEKTTTRAPTRIRRVIDRSGSGAGGRRDVVASMARITRGGPGRVVVLQRGVVGVVDVAGVVLGLEVAQRRQQEVALLLRAASRAASGVAGLRWSFDPAGPAPAAAARFEPVAWTPWSTWSTGRTARRSGSGGRPGPGCRRPVATAVGRGHRRSPRRVVDAVGASRGDRAASPSRAAATSRRSASVAWTSPRTATAGTP